MAPPLDRDDIVIAGYHMVTPLGDDLESMKGSWQLLLDEGARLIYPSHGKPFDAAVFKKYLNS